MFDVAYTKDVTNFKSAQGLYTYFSLIVDLYDAKKKSAQQMFDKYDDVIEVIEKLEKSYTEKLISLFKKKMVGLY